MNSFSAAKAAHHGPNPPNHIWASHARSILPRGAFTHVWVSDAKHRFIIGLDIILLWLGLSALYVHKFESKRKSTVWMRYSLKTNFCVLFSVFAGCQIPYPKREFLTEEEPEDKADKVRNVCLLFLFYSLFLCLFTELYCSDIAEALLQVEFLLYLLFAVEL